jgi:hypothetical protein
LLRCRSILREVVVAFLDILSGVIIDGEGGSQYLHITIIIVINDCMVFNIIHRDMLRCGAWEPFVSFMHDCSNRVLISSLSEL